MPAGDRPSRDRKTPSHLSDYVVETGKKKRGRTQAPVASSSTARTTNSSPSSSTQRSRPRSFIRRRRDVSEINVYGRFGEYIEQATTDFVQGNVTYGIPDLTRIRNFSNSEGDLSNVSTDVVFVRNVNIVQALRRGTRSGHFQIVNTSGNNTQVPSSTQGLAGVTDTSARIAAPVSVLDFNILPGGNAPVADSSDALADQIAELARDALDYMRDVLLDMNTSYYFRVTVYNANDERGMRLTVDRNFQGAYNFSQSRDPSEVSFPSRGGGTHQSHERRYWTSLNAPDISTLNRYRGDPQRFLDYLTRTGSEWSNSRTIEQGLKRTIAEFMARYEDRAGGGLNRIMIEAFDPGALGAGSNAAPMTVIDYIRPGSTMGSSSVGASSSGASWSGQSGNEIRIELSTKIIVVPETRTNCGFTSIAIGKGYLRTPELIYNRKKQKDHGNKLKKKSGLSGEIRLNQKGAKDISDKLKININIYFSDLSTPKWSIHNENYAITVNLITLNNHIGVILDKSKIGHGHLEEFRSKLAITVEDSNFRKIASHLFTNDLYLTPIPDPNLVKPKDKDRNTKIAAFDIEAYEYDENNVKIDQTPYLLGFGKFNNPLHHRELEGKIDYECFEGESSCVDFLRFLYENYYEYDGYTIYAHNFAKYDSYVMFQNGLFEVENLVVADLITQNGGMIYMKLKPIDDHKAVGITFMDSARLLQGSLKSLLEEFKTPHQKLDLEHQKMTASTWRESLDEAKTYLYNDVVGLLEMMEMFSKSEWEESQINITKTITAASLSKKTYFYNFYPKCLEKGWNLYHLPDWLDSYIRRGYFGGRNECFKIGIIDGVPIYYYDFTSLYPSESRKPVPCGEPVVIGDSSDVFEDDGRIKDSFTGFVRCYVTGPGPNQRPLHALVHNDKLMFPRILSEEIEMVLFSEEIRFAQKLGLNYTYKFKDAVYFKLEPILKDFMEFCFGQKAHQKKIGNIVKSKAYKIKANSGYGVFGLKTKFRDSVKVIPILSDKDIDKVNKTILFGIETGRFVGATDTGNHVVLRQAVDLKVKDFNVAVASAITSYARCALYEFGHDYGWENHIYADTDSFITFANIEDPKYAHLLPKYIPDYKEGGDWGNDLGAIKNEANDVIKFSKTPKEYDGTSNVPFDRCVILGCKSYCVERDWTDEKSYSVYGKDSLFKMAMKGVKVKDGIAGHFTGKYDQMGYPIFEYYNQPKKFDYDIFEKIRRGTEFVQRQLQFISGFQNMIDPSVMGGVRTERREKNIIPSYNKGKSLKDVAADYGDVRALTLIDSSEKDKFQPSDYDEFYDDTNDVPIVSLCELKTLLEAKVNGELVKSKLPRHDGRANELLIPQK